MDLEELVKINLNANDISDEKAEELKTKVRKIDTSITDEMWTKFRRFFLIDS